MKNFFYSPDNDTNIPDGFILQKVMPYEFISQKEWDKIESDVKTQHRIRYKIKGGKVYIAHILPQKFINPYQR